MKMNNLEKNIVVHAGGRTASHRMLDLILLNNDNIDISVPLSQDKSMYEYWHVERWSFARHIMEQDLRDINARGKKWVLKSAGNSTTAAQFRNWFRNNIIEVGIVREDLVTTSFSYLKAFLLTAYKNNADIEPFHLHDQAHVDYMESLEQDWINMWNDPAHAMQKQYALDQTIGYTITPVYQTLVQYQIAKFPCFTYDQIVNRPEEIFDCTDNKGSVFGVQIHTEQKQRHFSPPLEEFRAVVEDELTEHLKCHVPALNAIAPAGINFRL